MLRLYSYYRSSSAWRVRIALNHKQLPYELIPVHLLRDGGEQKSREFRDRNPLMQVPVLELEGPSGPVRLTQSVAIIEYLEETQPTPALFPKDPISRARVRQLVETVNSGIQPLQNLATQHALRNQQVDPTPVTRAFVEAGLSALEELAKSSAGRFLVDDELSAADLYLVPQLGFARRIEIDLAPYPTLLRVERECEPIPAFVAAHPKSQPDFEP